VNSDKKFDMLLETLVLDAYIKHNNAKDPLAMRELAIQNSKLRRMLSVKQEDPLAGARAVIGGRSTKKLAKERGKRDNAIGTQHKKVRSLLGDSIRATALKRNPNATRSEIRANITFIEKALGDSVTSFKEQLYLRRKPTPPNPSNPFGRLTGR
jgi:hypothetical protein